ncbi:cold-shock protein [Vibrio agarivorans]|uniref:cold-shock protein n=1 Tax=Vibrio agarivorans TaxID=153622 RepID=UPI0025B5FBBC|nr:cold shock domain-containing protein [Vibrio agarivorans]MDN3660369.1 cold shock domain-containing protein [Vibrio agarivorans]
MKGIVKSYNKDKKYGFINGKDGKSYFFHISDVPHNQHSQVDNGCHLDFDPTPTSKGDAAKKIHVVNTFPALYLPELQVLRNKQPKGVLLHTESGRTRFFRSPDDAKNRLVAIAKNAGANLVHDVRLNKSTWSEGNYKYSMFQAIGKISVCAFENKVFNQREADAITESVKANALQIHTKTKMALTEEYGELERQGSQSFTGVFFFIAFIVTAFLIAYA